MNEIHGAWFDPSNPVVQFSGKLRSDLFEWLCDMELATDLCLCLGTSLSGMNADRAAVTCAKRSVAHPPTVCPAYCDIIDSLDVGDRDYELAANAA